MIELGKHGLLVGSLLQRELVAPVGKRIIFQWTSTKISSYYTKENQLREKILVYDL